MTKLALAAALATALSTGMAVAETAVPLSTALSPYAATRMGHKPTSARTKHCTIKADSIGVKGPARAIYLRKCIKG